MKSDIRKQQDREWYQRNRDNILQRKKERYRANPQKYKEQSRAWATKNPDKRAAQSRRAMGGKPETTSRKKPAICEACGRPPMTKKGIVWDHNHIDGRFRGWLCSHCNTALGMLEDNQRYITGLLSYLLKNS